MVVNKKKRILIIILIIIFVVTLSLILLNIFRGPTIIVNNCNENYITNSKVCHKGDDYYYVDNKGRIHRLNGDNEDIFNDDFSFKYVACNSNYIYAANEYELIQFDPDGKVVNTMTKESNEKFYNVIFGIYASDNCIFCNLGGNAYIFLDPDTLKSMTVRQFINDSKETQTEDVYVCSNDEICLITPSGEIDMNGYGFCGEMVVDGKIVDLSLLSTDGIVGWSDKICFKYNTFQETVLTNLFDEKEYEIDKTDMRHMSLINDRIVAFSSRYSDNSMFEAMCFPYYEYSHLDDGLINEFPLILHKYDSITIIDPSNGNIKSIKTKSGERVIYLDDKKAVTYYKGEYIYYYIDSWEKYRSEKADEINSHSVYRFDACGDYIIVFDKKYSKLLNKIEIN